MKQFAMTFILALVFSTFTFAQDAAPKGPTTIIEFEHSSFDFGTIKSGEKVSHLFTFTNTGNMALVLKDVKGSCGCTVPQWPKEPIAPGEQGQLLVEFNSKGKSGSQSKRVTITANTDPGQTFLTIKGEVEKADDEKPAYQPIANGDKKGKQAFPEDCFAIYPNPTSDILKVDFKDHQGDKANIMILNTTGKILRSEVVQKVSDEVIEFDVHDYPAGTYYLKTQFGDQRASTKCFIVTR